MFFQGDGKCFAAGMSDGMMSVRKRKTDSHLSKEERNKKAYQFKMHKHSYKPSKVCFPFIYRSDIYSSIVVVVTLMMTNSLAASLI